MAEAGKSSALPKVALGVEGNHMRLLHLEYSRTTSCASTVACLHTHSHDPCDSGSAIEMLPTTRARRCSDPSSNGLFLELQSHR